MAVAEGANNIAFSIPINTVKNSLNEFNQTGKFPQKPFLGVEYQMLSQQVALLNNVPQGAYVESVVSGSPADKAGIEAGDVIFKADGKSLSASNDTLSNFIATKKVGDSVRLSVWRDGSEKDIAVILTAAGQ